MNYLNKVNSVCKPGLNIHTLLINKEMRMWLGNYVNSGLLYHRNIADMKSDTLLASCRARHRLTAPLCLVFKWACTP